MKQFLFYEDQLIGSFDSMVSANVAFFCWHCGRIFARRTCERPLCWMVDQGACAKCLTPGHSGAALVLFQVGGELLDHVERVPLVRAQFLYELEAFK